jgi:aspartyl/glutamyl-tRNA(Asn/Gln) amidotransferase C subunit
MSNPIVTIQDVQKVANLGRLSQDPEQLTKALKDLQSTLKMVEQISNIDTTGISPHTAFGVINLDSLRSDIPPVDNTSYQRIRSNIINGFPNRQGDLLQLSTRIVE